MLGELIKLLNVQDYYGVSNEIDIAKGINKAPESIKEAYKLSIGLSAIYNQHTGKGVALTKMAHWFKDVDESGFKSFATIKRTFEQHYQSILNYFDNRSTNAYAESFNAKIKEFRRSFRGVKDIKFFLFRLTNIFV